MGLRDIFQGDGPGGAAFWVEGVGADPLHGKVPGKISTRGRKADNVDTDVDTGGL